MNIECQDTGDMAFGRPDDLRRLKAIAYSEKRITPCRRTTLLASAQHESRRRETSTLPEMAIRPRRLYGTKNTATHARLATIVESKLYWRAEKMLRKVTCNQVSS